MRPVSKLRRWAILACSLCVALAQGFAGAAPETRQITDAAGRHVTIPENVTRVADPWHANNAMVLMLGGAATLVATSVQAKSQPWLRRLYPPIEAMPAAFNAAGEVNMETLIGARPDVILMAYDGSLPKWFTAVDSAYQIPVVLMPNSSLDGLKTTALLTGEVLGPKELGVAREFVRYFDDNIQRVLRVTGKLAVNSRPKVLHTSSAGILTAELLPTLRQNASILKAASDSPEATL